MIFLFYIIQLAIDILIIFKKNKMKKCLIYFSLIFLYAKSSAQVFVNSYDSSHVPPSGIFGSSKEINEIIIPPVDTSELKNNISNKIFKSAEPKPVDISPMLKGFKVIKGKDVIYRQKIIAQNAASIAITFDKLNLSKNAQLYLYNPEGTVITGPITAKENIGLDKKNKQWSSNSFKGNSVILEFKLSEEEVNQNDLHIFKIRFGLPKTLSENLSDSVLIGAFNASSPCNKILFAQREIIGKLKEKLFV